MPPFGFIPPGLHSAVEHFKQLASFVRIRIEHALISGRNGFRSRRAYTAHRHTHVLGFHRNRNTLRGKLLCKEIGNVVCKTFLKLRTAREAVDYSRKL